jgi:hypothetical protein
MLQENIIAGHAQRVHMDLERHHSGDRVVIEVENHDEGLGWYTSGSLTLPLEQLPLLEQAIEAMRARCRSEEYGKIIPFPAAQAQVAG